MGRPHSSNSRSVFKLIKNSTTSNLHKVKLIVAWLLEFFINRHISSQNQLLFHFVKLLSFVKNQYSQLALISDEEIDVKRRDFHLPTVSQLGNYSLFCIRMASSKFAEDFSTRLFLKIPKTRSCCRRMTNYPPCPSSVTVDGQEATFPRCQYQESTVRSSKKPVTSWHQNTLKRMATHAVGVFFLRLSLTKRNGGQHIQTL